MVDLGEVHCESPQRGNSWQGQGALQIVVRGPCYFRQQEGRGSLRGQAGRRYLKRKQEGSEDRFILHSVVFWPALHLHSDAQ